MTFLSPDKLWLLLAVAGLGVTYVVLQARRRHYAVRFTNLELLDSVAPRRPGWRRHVAAVAVGLGLCSLVVALARPVRDERVPREGAVVMLAVDVSTSMTATDVAPSRLAAAVEAAEQFVTDMPKGNKVGLVAFNGAARVLANPTTDHAEVIGALQGLDTADGTAPGDGIYAALDAIRTELGDTNQNATGAAAKDKAPVASIVMLSDGVPTVGRPVEEAAQAAADADVAVSTIAYGTQDGTVVVDGQTIPVPADEQTMRQVAEATDGTFFTASSSDQLKRVYEDIQSRVGYRTEQREILRAFLAVGLVALIVAVGASMLWTGRFL